jgi:MFS family permease
MQLMKDSGSRSSTLGMLLCGICTSAGGIVTALLQERYGLSYVWSGTFLSCLSAGQLAASLLVGFLAQWWHLRGAVLTLVTGAMLGYGLMLFTSNPVLLALGLRW